MDAFTESAFKGNPAAVCLLEEEKDEKWLQLVATEFNLSETCFLTRIDLDSPNPRFHLTWFTPVAEVHLLLILVCFLGFYDSPGVEFWSWVLGLCKKLIFLVVAVLN